MSEFTRLGKSAHGPAPVVSSHLVVNVIHEPADERAADRQADDRAAANSHYLDVVTDLRMKPLGLGAIQALLDLERLAPPKAGRAEPPRRRTLSTLRWRIMPNLS